MPIAYSYIRFSSEKQTKGDSLRRQTAMAERFIRTHPELELALSPMSLADEGMSAYRGANAKKGALKAFLRAVEEDEIPKGSYLLVENFDRLSRQDPLTSIAQLTELTGAGIKVVTLVDEKVYSTETLSGMNGTWMLMQSIMTMARAHEESVTKGMRVRAAWDSKKTKIREGIQLTKRVPFWMNSDRRVKKDKVKLVKEIFKLHQSGIGGTRICKLLNERNEATPSGRGLWQQSTIRKLVTGKAVLGVLQASNEEYPGYFPQVISEEIWLSANAMLGSGRKPIDKKNDRSLQGLFRCYCGASMRVQSRTGRVKKDGTRSSWTYVVCSVAAVGGDCPFKSVSYARAHAASLSLVDEARALYANGDASLEQILNAERMKQKAKEWYDTCAKEYRSKKTAATRDAFYAADEDLALITHELSMLRDFSGKTVTPFVDNSAWWRNHVKAIQVDTLKLELNLLLLNGSKTSAMSLAANKRPSDLSN